MCVKLNSNSFTVLPGIKSKMNILKSALLKKFNLLKKQSLNTSSDIRPMNNSSTTSSSTNYNTANHTSVSLPTSSLNSEDKLKQHLIQSIDDWCKKMNQNKDEKIFHLKENIDYNFLIDLNSNKVLIQCQCGKVSTLGQKDNSYIVSIFSRDCILLYIKSTET